MKISGINRRSGETYDVSDLITLNYRNIKLNWSGVRGLPPALPLVEDVSLLILTPLVPLHSVTLVKSMSCRAAIACSISKSPPEHHHLNHLEAN